MKNLFLGVIVCLVFGCSTSSKIANDCISKVKSELADDWKYIPDSGYYKSKKIFNLDSDSIFRDCLMKLDSSDIVSLFGKPTKFHPKAIGYSRGKYVFEYAISPPC